MRSGIFSAGRQYNKIGGFGGLTRKFGSFIGNKVAPRLAQITNTGAQILGGADKAVRFIQGIPLIGAAAAPILTPLEAGLNVGSRILGGVSKASAGVAALGAAARANNGQAAQVALGNLAAQAQGARSAFERR